MNLLLGTPSELDSLGGVTSTVRMLADRLSAAGDRVVYLIPKHGGRLERVVVDGRVAYRVSMRAPFVPDHPLRSPIAFALFFPLVCYQLIRILRRERIDLINLHYFQLFAPSSWIYLLVIGYFFRYRLVVSLHGMKESNVRLFPLCHASVDQLVFCSDAFRKQALRGHPQLEAKSTVIPHGIEISGKITRERDASPGRRLVCVGRLYEHKGQDILLRAFRYLADDFSDLDVELIGDGPFRSSLLSLSQELGLADRVVFRGGISREEVLGVLRRASISCLPSRGETFGLVLLEAMAVGTPVIATRVGGIPEVVRDGIDGLLVAPDDPRALSDAIRKLLSDDVLRSRLVGNAKRRVREKFSLDRFVSEYRHVFLGVPERELSRQKAGFPRVEPIGNKRL